MLFADDTNILIQGENTTDLMHRAEIAMVKLADWLSDNRLSLSIEKTEYSIFHSARSKIPDNCDQLNFPNISINRVCSSKYIGMIIDDKLTWNSHINYLVRQLVKYIVIFKLISKLIPHSCKRQLYFANIYSRVQYGIDVYGQACIGQLKKVQVMQNRTIKVLYNLDRLTPTNNLHMDLSILIVKDIFKLQVTKFVYKQTGNCLPSIFIKYLTTNAQVHRCRTRQVDRLHVPISRTTHGVKSIKVTGVNVFNRWPLYTTNSLSINSFKLRVRKHLLLQY